MIDVARDMDLEVKGEMGPGLARWRDEAETRERRERERESEYIPMHIYVCIKYVCVYIYK